MSFLSGGVTVQQFRVECGPASFDESHIERLKAFAAGRDKPRAADGVGVGWSAGGHIFDTAFACDKNLRGEFLVFDLRVDSEMLPASLLKAYTEIELYTLAKDNPNGPPTARQRREARKAARDRLENEAQDGRFTKRSLIPVVWDVKAGRVWFGSAAATHVDRFAALFQQTFRHAVDRVHTGNLDRATPVTAVTDWVPGVTPDEYEWDGDLAGGRWLGNDFLTWLLTQCGTGHATIRTPAGVVTVLVNKSLKLECPRGQTGTAKFTHTGPSRMPEVIQALKAGKLPRSAGLILVNAGEQYELTLAGDQWAITAGKVPKPEDKAKDKAQAEVQRLEAVRQMLETVEDLFLTFTRMRSHPERMAGVVGEFRTWVGLPGGTSDVIPDTHRGQALRSVVDAADADRAVTESITGDESGGGCKAGGGDGPWQDGDGRAGTPVDQPPLIERRPLRLSLFDI